MHQKILVHCTVESEIERNVKLKKKKTNSRIMTIQSEMSERALELLALPEDESCYLLDLGCGSGS